MGSDDDQSYVPSAQEEDSDGDSIMTDPKTKKPDAVNLLAETGCLPSGGGNLSRPVSYTHLTLPTILLV